MIDGRAIIEFGLGSTAISSYVHSDKEIGCIVLNKANLCKCEPDGIGKPYIPTKEDTILLFHDIDAIEALIDVLGGLQEMMIGEFDNCPKIQIQDVG